MKEYAREMVMIANVGLIALAFCYNPSSALLIGAMIANFTSVTNFYFGSSKTGSETAAKNADAVTQAARSSNEVQSVEVVNDPAKPVPTVET